MAAVDGLKLDIFIVSPGLPHGPGTLDTASLGGSETAAIEVGEAIARRGHVVTVFSPCEKPGDHKNVHYEQIANFVKYAQATPHDVLVVSRAFEACRFVTGARQTWLWCHDLLTKRSRADFAGALWNLEGVLLLSEFHGAQFAAMTGLNVPQFVVTRNGIDLGRIAAASVSERQRKKIMFTSRPERGLDVLVQVARRLWDMDPEATICVSSYANFPEHLKDYYAQCWQAVERCPNMVNLGTLSKSELYEHYKSAQVLLYPGSAGPFREFREISYLGAMEAMACGCVPVACRKGAVPETVGDAGVLVGEETTDSASETHLDECARAVVKLLKDEDAWAKLSEAGIKRAAGLSWDGVAKQWEELFVGAYMRRANEA